MIPSDPRCPAQRTLLIIGGHWKVPIVYHLTPAPMRFSELRRRLTPVTPKMLTQQLRELERDGVIKRRIYAQIPPKVEYSLTPAGKSLLPVVKAMCHWGSRNRSCSIRRA